MINSKGETLLNLKNKLNEFKVPNSYVFEVKDWQSNSDKIVFEIRKKFKNKKIIVRSSSKSEDNFLTSAAGKFESILNVDLKNKARVSRAINKVIKSYNLDKKKVVREQVLIQEMIGNIKMSGVIFTGENSGNNLYYIINYDDITGLTNTITSGSSNYSNKNLYILKKKEKYITSARFKKLIKAIKELEAHFNSISLDIEFGLTKDDKLYLFQVRSVITKDNFSINHKKFDKKILINFKKIKKIFHSEKNINGNYTILSQMTDWNPAEMIGQSPSNLSYSLYSKLITNSSWLEARKIMGYKSNFNKTLMHKVAGKPYIDVRKSINSFLPKKLDLFLSTKLVNKSIEKLRLFPALHDKVEFELAPTSYCFDFYKRISKIYPDISSADKQKAEKIYSEIFFKNIDKRSNGSIEKNIEKINFLEQLHESKIYKIDGSLKNIKMILNNCVKYGIIPFSILARHAFISKEMLNSLTREGVISDKISKKFENNISTITSEFLNDQLSLKKDNKNIKLFMKKYGHLRPGTYDIKSLCYDQIDKDFFLKNDVKNSLNKKIKNEKIFNFKKYETSINKYLDSHNFSLDAHNLFDYFEKSIILREYAKFVFTKSISIILENIRSYCKKKKIQIDDIELLEISDLMKKNSKKNILNKININKNDYYYNQHIKLPEIIVGKTNMFVGASVVSVPNFVTYKLIEGNVIFLNSKKTNLKLKDKIVLIENADPGYDWLFGQNIKGLITKFGGANSHMTIRCNELEIPAAIGCGDTLFSKLEITKKLVLNCKNKIIKIL